MAEGEDIKLKDNVVVIGGGNVAVDAAMTALRCGASDVKMACLECWEEMPASPWELEEAEAEGIKLVLNTVATRIQGDNGRVEGMECARSRQLSRIDQMEMETIITADA